MTNNFEMLRPIIFITGIILLGLIGCSEEPYVEQMNKANDIINQGKLNNSREELQAAVEEYSKVYVYALTALEKQYDALFNLAVLHAYNGEYQNCIQVMTQAYQLRRDDPSFFYYWGMCYANQAKISLDSKLRQENIDNSVKTYRLGLDLAPNDYQLNYGLGVLYGFIIEDYGQALEYLNTAHNSKADDINTLFSLANLNYKLGRVDESIGYFSTIMRIAKPDSPSYQQAKANLDKIK